MTIYGTLADSKIYHAARGHTAWAAATDAALTIALLRGSEYIDISFRSRFPGLKTLARAQDREWPRSWAYDTENNAIGPDVVPVEVEHASYEASLRELQNPGSLLPDVVLGEQIKAASVDGAVSVEYSGVTGAAAMRPLLSMVAGILAPVLTAPGGSALVGRADRI